MDLLGAFKGIINHFFKTSIATSFPHQPKFECVYLAATLNALVTNIVAHIVEFICLEQTGGRGTVASIQNILHISRRSNNRINDNRLPLKFWIPCPCVSLRKLNIVKGPRAFCEDSKSQNQPFKKNTLKLIWKKINERYVTIGYRPSGNGISERLVRLRPKQPKI